MNSTSSGLSNIAIIAVVALIIARPQGEIFTFQEKEAGFFWKTGKNAVFIKKRGAYMGCGAVRGKIDKFFSSPKSAPQLIFSVSRALIKIREKMAKNFNPTILFQEIFFFAATGALAVLTAKSASAVPTSAIISDSAAGIAWWEFLLFLRRHDRLSSFRKFLRRPWPLRVLF